MNLIEIEKKLKEVTSTYPDALAPLNANNWKRIIWQVNEVINTVPKGGTVMDFGAGVVPFMGVCQVLGYKTIMIDDFAEQFDSLDMIVKRG